MYLRSRTTLERQHGFEPVRVEGAIPEALTGTLYRVGGILFERFGARYDHVFEGDGGVMAVRMSPHGAHYAHKLIRGSTLEAEERAGKPHYGPGASRARRIWNALRMDIKNTANTSLFVWQDRMFALMEAAKPTEIDPGTLETRGETDLDGVIAQKFSAHPRRVESLRTTFNFGLRYGPFSKLDLYALPDDGPARRLGTLPMRRNWMVHDFAVTPKHAVFLVSPVRFNVGRVLMGAGFLDFFDWLPNDGTEVIVAPLDDPASAVRFVVDAFHVWHFLGAREHGSEIEVHMSAYDDFDSFEAINTDTGPKHGARISRAVIDPVSRTLVREELTDVRADFPHGDLRHAGAGYSTGYFVASSSHRGYHRVETATGATRSHVLPDHLYPSEAVFVPRAHDSPEGDGYLLALMYDSGTDHSRIVVLDTARIEDAPLATVHLGCFVPLSTHGLWHPQRSLAP